jgi:LysR family transcriptional regulator, pca operon transcriptional activator
MLAIHNAAAQRVKFRHLICFLEVARLKSLVKAADVLGVTQPAVSKTLHELEEILDVRLFERTHRDVSLTHFGHVFLQYAGASITAMRQGVDSISQAKITPAVTVIVGALPTGSTSVLPDAVKLFTQETTASKIQIITGPHPFLVDKLREGEIDFILGRMAEPSIMKGFSFEHLYSESLALVVRKEHPLLLESRLDFNTITNYPVLMAPHGSAVRPIIDRFLVAQGIGTLNDRVETASTSFGRRYIRASDAIWFVTESAVAEDIKSGELTALPFDMTQTLAPIGLTRRIDEPLSIQAQSLIRCIRLVSVAYSGSI